ncbi:hypothetical protein KAR10_07805 [bacterium]|nr:hypothetical protein [bacterium]
MEETKFSREEYIWAIGLLKSQISKNKEIRIIRKFMAGNGSVKTEAGYYQSEALYITYVGSDKCIVMAHPYLQVFIESFQTYWDQFRSAVINGEMTKVVALTKFPFEAHGALDFCPVYKYDEKDFLKIYDKLMKTEEFCLNEKEPLTMFEFIKKKKEIVAKDIGEYTAHIGGFGFRKTAGVWLFIRACLDDEKN